MESFLIHDPGETEICNQEVGIVFGSAEQQVLRLQIAVDDSVVVEVGNRGESCSYQIRCIGLVVTALSTYSVEELAAQGEICDEIYCVGDLRQTKPLAT